MSIKLKELGYIPYIIGTRWKYYNITFINQTTNLVVIQNNFSEIKENDYDILIVNSDQTWRKYDKHFYDYGFLKFAENWKVKKFAYGASIGLDYWKMTKDDEQIAKNLLKDFSGISVREEGSIKLIKEHLGIIYHSEDFINDVKNASSILNYDIYFFNLNNNSKIQNFIYYMVKSDAVMTNAFHGTVFSIIFNKPFITIYNKSNAKERYNTLDYLFGIHDRLFIHGQQINIELLLKPLEIDYKHLNQFKANSINFLKSNLEK